ncbi:MAG TPA: CHAT domain-containing protein [Longimicrobium sp.]|nr:CHAT domain-containing protein [Longimicrobium sp.]
MLLVLVAAALLIAVGTVVYRVRTRTLYARLAAIAPERAILPRTSLEGKYRECRVERSDSAIPDVACPGAKAAGGEPLEDIAAEAERRLKQGPNADAYWTRALIELHPRPAVAIALLEQALPLSRDSADVMADLAAAHVRLAGQEQTMENLLAALDWSLWALALKPNHPKALFNRALALELLPASIGAEQAWTAFLKASETTGDPLWRSEAGARLHALNEKKPPVTLPALDASDAELARFAREHLQGAVSFGWYTLLGAWADTLLAGDSTAAEALLRRAGVLGAALAEHGGDAVLHDYVRAVRANPARLGVAAEALRLEVETWSSPVERLDSLLARLGTYPLTRPQEIRVLLQHAKLKLDRQEAGAAEPLLDRVAAMIDTLRYPTLVARMHWWRGTQLSQDGEYEASAAEYVKSEAVYARLGDENSRGKVRFYISDAERRAGNSAAANTWLHRAATSLRPFGPSLTRGYVMKGMAEAALSLHLPRAMRALADEMVANNENGVGLAEARFTRAVLLAAAGGNDAALQELAALGPVDAFEEGATRNFMAASSAYVRALARLESAPDSVIEMVKVLIGYDGQDVWPTRGFALSVQARLALHDTVGAVRDLDSLFVALDEARDGRGGAGIRELVDGDVRRSVVRLAGMLAPTHPREALEFAERGAAALSSVTLGDTRLPRKVPDGRVVVRPLVLDDALLIWILEGSRIDVTVSGVRPAELFATIDSADTALLRDRGYEPYLSRLYQMLIGPVEQRLEGAKELVFVHEAELGGIPLPALRDPAGRYLMQKHVVWRAVSVAAAGGTPDLAPPDSAAFSAPDFDQDENQTLPLLPHAKAEVDSVSLLYPRRFTITGSASTPTAFRDALSRYPLIHFAGHAVVNNMRSERSHVVLAPEPGTPKGHLAAEQLEGLDLRHVRLIVLSACSTLGGDEGSVGFTGLSGALLGAGARGVMGSLWRVDDRATGQLMRSFHEEYRKQRKPMHALRAAQLRMLRSADAVESSPRTWAAFQYVGR